MVERSKWKTTYVASKFDLRLEMNGSTCRYHIHMLDTGHELISDQLDYMEGVQCMLALLCVEYPEPEIGRLERLTGWELRLEGDTLYLKTSDRSRHTLSMEDLALSVIIHQSRTHPCYLIGYADDEEIQITLHDSLGLSYRSTVHTALELSRILEDSEQGTVVCGLLDADAVWQEDGYLIQYGTGLEERCYYWLEVELVDRFLANLQEEFSQGRRD